MSLPENIPAPLDIEQRRAEIAEDIRVVASVGANGWVILSAAAIAALTGRYTGRRQAAFENTVIGGIYAAFSAYRDPRSDWWMQLIVAAGQGVTWGLTDVYFPVILDAITGRRS